MLSILTFGPCEKRKFWIGNGIILSILSFFSIFQKRRKQIFCVTIRALADVTSQIVHQTILLITNKLRIKNKNEIFQKQSKKSMHIISFVNSGIFDKNKIQWTKQLR